MRTVRKALWLRAIAADPLLSPTTARMLQRYADWAMTPGGQLQQGAKKLAERFNRNQRSVIRHLAEAYERCYLLQTAPGYNDHAAVFLAAVPDFVGEQQERRPHRRRVTKNVTHSTTLDAGMGDENCHPSELLMGDAPKHPSAGGKGDKACHPIKKDKGEQREHVAVNSSAAVVITTTEPAATHSNGSDNSGNKEDEVVRTARSLVDAETPSTNGQLRLVLPLPGAIEPNQCMRCGRPVTPTQRAIEHGWPTICFDCGTLEEAERQAKAGRR